MIMKRKMMMRQKTWKVNSHSPSVVSVPLSGPWGREGVKGGRGVCPEELCWPRLRRILNHSDYHYFFREQFITVIIIISKNGL